MSLNFNYTTAPTTLFQSAQNLVQSTVDQFIVRPIGSPTINGISGFIFDVIEDEEIMLDSDITDQFVEENYAIQDHIALKPVRFTLRGYSAEIVDVVPNALATIYSQLKSLQTLGGLAPGFNVQDAQFYATVNNTVQLATSVFNEAKNVFQLFGLASTTSTKQQAAYQFFYNMWKTRQLCTVETPFANFDSMAIESVRALQKGDTKYVSDFMITFKQIQTVKAFTLVNDFNSLMSQNFGSLTSNPNLVGGVAKNTVAAVSQLGTDPGKATNSNGDLFTVANTQQTYHLQQAQLPAVY